MRTGVLLVVHIFVLPLDGLYCAVRRAVDSWSCRPTGRGGAWGESENVILAQQAVEVAVVHMSLRC